MERAVWEMRYAFQEMVINVIGYPDELTLQQDGGPIPSFASAHFLS